MQMFKGVSIGTASGFCVTGVYCPDCDSNDCPEHEAECEDNLDRLRGVIMYMRGARSATALISLYLLDERLTAVWEPGADKQYMHVLKLAWSEYGAGDIEHYRVFPEPIPDMIKVVL